MRNHLLLWLLLVLTAPCWSVPVTDHYLWLMPYSSVDLSLTSAPIGSVVVNQTRQEEPRCWRLIPAKSASSYYIVCAGYGGKRGLAIKDGKVYLAADRGLVWKIEEVTDSQFRVGCDQGQLSYDSKTKLATLTKGTEFQWNIWPRQQVGHSPEPGNYVRSDQSKLWKINVEGLRGRSKPDPESSVVRRFRRGQQLQIDYGRGGSDEVFWNAVDRDGNTWIKVSTREGQPLNCYIRANPRWVVPVADKSK